MSSEKAKQWALANKGMVLKIPREIKPETYTYFPSIGQGQNALGYFLMQTRNKIRNNSKNKLLFNNETISEENEETAADNEEENNALNEASNNKNVEDICLQLAKMNVENALQQQQQQQQQNAAAAGEVGNNDDDKNSDNDSDDNE